jgi:hypothetical protein
VLLVHVCARRLEHDRRSLVLGEQPVDAVGGGGQAGLGGQLQAGRAGVDAHHVAQVDDVRALQLVHQVGTDVAGPDDRRGHLA